MANDPFAAALRAHAARCSLSGAAETRDDLRTRSADNVRITRQSHDFARDLEVALAHELATGEPLVGIVADSPSVLTVSVEQPLGSGAVKDRGAALGPTTGRWDASPPPVSYAVDPVDVDAVPANELGDDLSAHELAKRYAPRLPEPADNGLKDGGIDPAPPARPSSETYSVIAAAPGSVYASGGEVSELPGRALSAGQRPRRGNSTSKPAAWAIALVAVAGGFGTIMALELLMAPKAAPGATVVAGLPDVGATNDEPLGSRMDASPAKARRLAFVATSGAEVISVDGGEKSLKPVRRAAPAAATGFIAPLAPALNSIDQRGSSDGANADTAVPERAALTRGAETGPAADPAPHRVSVDVPAAARPGAAGSDGAGSGETMPPLRVPTPRPDAGVPVVEASLAYAPAADPVDLAAKVMVAKAKYKPAAKSPKPGPARIVSWANWVNMRASADNQSESVMTLSAGSLVSVLKCASWCEIVADGKRGFVLKSLLSGTGIGATPTAADRLRKRAESQYSNPYLKVSNQ